MSTPFSCHSGIKSSQSLLLRNVYPIRSSSFLVLRNPYSSPLHTQILFPRTKGCIPFSVRPIMTRRLKPIYPRLLFTLTILVISGPRDTVFAREAATVFSSAAGFVKASIEHIRCLLLLLFVQCEEGSAGPPAFLLCTVTEIKKTRISLSDILVFSLIIIAPGQTGVNQTKVKSGWQRIK